MTTLLGQMELDSCHNMITSKNKDLAKEAGKIREKMETELCAQREELARHLLSHNNSKEGIITWLKPNVSFEFNPEPINLKEALKYLMDHEEYQSNGFALYDLINDDVDTQYEKILKIIRQEDRGESSAPQSR